MATEAALDQSNKQDKCSALAIRLSSLVSRFLYCTLILFLISLSGVGEFCKKFIQVLSISSIAVVQKIVFKKLYVNCLSQQRRGNLKLEMR